MSRKKLYELYCHLRTTFKIEHISELELIDKLKQCVNNVKHWNETNR